MPYPPLVHLPVIRRIATRILPTAVVAAVLTSAAVAADIVKTSHMVPMRDGVRLATDVYLPADADGPLPAILIRTPYSKDKGGKNIAEMGCRGGYAVVAQDMRGRFKSEGRDAIVFHNSGWNDRRDGHDTINWVARQTWCDGNLGSWGGSALGIVQNFQAVDAPEQLKAQFVLVAFSNMYTQAGFQGGAFRKSLVEGWLKGNKFQPKNLETMVAHPLYDSFWDEMNPEKYADRVNAPGIYWGGWYDIFVQGTINSFVTIQEKGGPRARGNCRLVLGPWAHGKFNELKYPLSSNVQPRAASAFRFFDHWLKGADNGVADDKPIHYYVMGDPEAPDAPGNYWRSVESWPPPSKPLDGYFHADGLLSIHPPTEDDAELTYKYDPENPVPTVGGQNLNLPKGPMDQRKVENRPDVLLFTSEPLKEPIEVTGRIYAKLFVSSDCPDTDFTVKLCDVYPDGRSMLVTDGILRARHRESFQREDFLKPGEVYELNVDLWTTSIVFNTGHCVRVAVSSSNNPRFDPNPNTGKPFRADDETRVATNTLHVSKQHPSHIIFPVYAGPTEEK